MFPKHNVSSAHRYIFSDERTLWMAIVEWPDDINTETRVRCIVCKQRIFLRDVTPGLLTQYGEQTFICNSHMEMSESLRFLRAGIDFLLEQKKAA